jgi:YD repeat-containing protein
LNKSFKTITSKSYTYDSRGNILSRTEYSYTTSNHLYSPTKTATFEYSSSGWTDQLVKVNNTPLTYDEVGNVLTYGNRSFSWNTGRQLAAITEGSNTYSYTYDENGIRTSKTYEGVTTYYTTEDGVITSQYE